MCGPARGSWCAGTCVSGTLLGPNAGVSCPAGSWDYSGSCSSSGGPLLVIVAVVLPLIVIGAAVSLYTRYCRRGRRERMHLTEEALHGQHFDALPPPSNS